MHLFSFVENLDQLGNGKEETLQQYPHNLNLKGTHRASTDGPLMSMNKGRGLERGCVGQRAVVCRDMGWDVAHGTH